MYKITIPATTANMGPGFDSIGMALNMYNELTVFENEDMDKDFEIIVKKQQKMEIPITSDNLIYKTMCDFYKKADRKMPKVKLVQNDDIPLTRGLGSSAACIVAGLVAANTLSGANLSKDELTSMACIIEKHPDNVAPAILGGLVIGAISEDRLSYTRVEIPDDIVFATMIPDFAMSTEHARGILPETYSKSDMIFNISRSALLASSMLTQNWDNLKVATQDVLHQPYRKALIPDMEDIFQEALSNKACGAFLSGAGSTLIAIVKKEDSQIFLSKMKEYLGTLSKKWDLTMLSADNIGVRIE